MAVLTHDQRVIRNALIREAHERNPGAGFGAAIRAGTAQAHAMARRGLREAIATSTNQFNDPHRADDQDDVGGNSFEAFLDDMIDLIARKAAADGKVNPAYTALAAKLAAAQAQSMGGVQSRSFVAPAAGSTPTGRTGESLIRAKVIGEALTHAGLALHGQLGTAAGQAVTVPGEMALAEMNDAELQRYARAAFGELHREGSLRAPFYKAAA